LNSPGGDRAGAGIKPEVARLVNAAAVASPPGAAGNLTFATSDSEQPKINRVSVKQTIVQRFEDIWNLASSGFHAPKVSTPREA
jgi:hypothetical protein